jgi:hypothetical protein
MANASYNEVGPRRGEDGIACTLGVVEVQID